MLDLCVFQHGGGDVSHQSECVRPWCVFQHVEVLSHQSECVRLWCVFQHVEVLSHISQNVLDRCVFQHGGGAVSVRMC